VFHFQLGPEFKAGAARLAQPLAPFAQRISQRFFTGARSVILGGVAGWAAVVIAGAVLMANAGHDGVASPPPAPAVAAAPAAPAPPAAKVETTEVPAQPAGSPIVAKSTQRVDMTPTAAIPAEPVHKLKHKAHKKKAKDIDNPN